MANSFGKIFCITTFGESHGKAIGCVVDGCPSGLPLTDQDVQAELMRRRPGSSKFVTPRQEEDRVQVLTGLYNGRTTGSPLLLLINNNDVRSGDYESLLEVFRPGHADYSYFLKYHNRDHRGGGRSSARLTAALVAGGSVAKKWLRCSYGILTKGYVATVGLQSLSFVHWHYVGRSPFFVPVSCPSAIEVLINKAISRKNSLSASFRLFLINIPCGIGEPLFDKLSSCLASGVTGVNAVKMCAIGLDSVGLGSMGASYNDNLTAVGFTGNNLGGVVGGITTGQDVVVTAAVKPTASINQFRRSLNSKGESLVLRTKGRHDPCVGLRAIPILEAIGAVVLADLILQQSTKQSVTWQLTNVCHPGSYLY